MIRTGSGDELPGGAERPSTFKLWYLPAGLIALFTVICIPILFAMVANVKKDSSTTAFAGTASFSASASISRGKVVSLDSAGGLQLGGGTSIYKNVVDVTADCPSYLSMDSVFGNTYVISYANKVTNQATLQVVKVNSGSPNVGALVNSEKTTYYISEIATLDSAAGTFVGVCQDFNATGESAYIVAGKIDPTTYEITLVRSDTPYADTYSVDPSITRLSDTNFAVAYYNFNPAKIATRFGSVDTDTAAITFSAPTFVVDDKTYSIYFDIVGMTSTSYLVFYFDGTNPVSDYYGYGSLVSTLATTSGDLAQGNGNITLSETTMLTDAQPVYSLESTRLDSTTAVVAFSDYGDNFGIRCQAVELGDNGASASGIVYGSSWSVTNGQASSAVSNLGLFDLDVKTISDDGSFMVLYSDLSNKGHMTATVGEVTGSGELIRSSPDFLLNAGNDDLTGLYTWGAIAAGVTTTYASQTAILTSITNGDCSAEASIAFSVMEILPSPVGLAVSSGSVGSNVDVAIMGTAQDLESLQTGVVYYGNTAGDLISGSSYYGRDKTTTSTTAHYYLYDASTDTILTSSSRVGVATSTDKLLIKV